MFVVFWFLHGTLRPMFVRLFPIRVSITVHYDRCVFISTWCIMTDVCSFVCFLEAAPLRYIMTDVCLFVFRKEIQAIFDKYAQKNVRRLKRDEAIVLLNKEFNLTEDQAAQMFDSFDQDKNGIMSIWEFQQFYQTIGKS